MTDVPINHVNMSGVAHQAIMMLQIILEKQSFVRLKTTDMDERRRMAEEKPSGLGAIFWLRALILSC